MIVTIKAIIPKHPLINTAKLESAVEGALDNISVKARDDFNKTTSTWHNRPAFLIAKSKGERIVSTSDKIYRFVSEGTKVRRVIMTPDFMPKTKFRFIGAGPGFGGVAFGPSKKINRPGIKAREFAETIAEKWEKELPIELQRAIDFVVK